MSKKIFKDQLVEGNDKCTLLLYGYIGQWDDVKAADVETDLLLAETKYNNIDVRINSMGGEVYEGIAIFNALRKCKGNVNVYVDGIA